MSLSDVKDIAAKKENPLQKVIKALSDVFVEIIPAILAAAILLGVTGFLANFEAVKTNQTLYAINRLAFLASVGIFAVLPMVVVYLLSNEKIWWKSNFRYSCWSNNA